MNPLKKTFVPDSEQTGAGFPPTVKSSVFSIVLKLAKNNGFNNENQIRGASGGFVEGTDIAALVAYAVQPEKLLRGKLEFASLLTESGVPPSLVANENLRKHMMPILSAQKPPRAPTPPPTPPETRGPEPRVITNFPPPQTQMVVTPPESSATKALSDAAAVPLPTPSTSTPKKRGRVETADVDDGQTKGKRKKAEIRYESFDDGAW